MKQQLEIIVEQEVLNKTFKVYGILKTHYS